MEPLIPIVLFVSLFGAIFGIRYLASKEKLAMIQQGMDPGVRKQGPFNYATLKAGLLLVGAGLGLLLAVIFDHSFLRSNINGGGLDAIYVSLIGIFGGSGLLVSYLIEKRDLKNNRNLSSVEPEVIH